MNKIFKINFIRNSVFILLFFSNLSAGSLGGAPGYFAYQPKHNVFYNRQSAIGCVRMDNGFTVTVTKLGAESKIGSSVIMDTCVSVSGAIDLRDTNTIILLSDLILDHGVTLSSSGSIYGYDRALILNGNLTIPAEKVIHIGGRLIINGQGHKLSLDNNAQIFVDTNATLTLKNLVLQNTRNQPGHPCIQCGALSSNICLDNVEFNLADDFYFNRGHLFIYNDVTITGSSAFVYRSPVASFITSNATLYFDIGTTFDFQPSTTGTPQLLAKDLLFMQDATSRLFLNGCSLKTTLTGMRLTKGQIIFDNNVSLSSAAVLGLTDNLTTVTSWIFGVSTYAVSWSPDGRYLAVGGQISSTGLVIYSFNGSGLIKIDSIDYGSGVTHLNWSPDGRYLAVAEYAGIGFFSIYAFNGSTLTRIFSINYGTDAFAVNWSPDGRYLAVGGNNHDTSNLTIYSFNGLSLNPIASANHDDPVSSIDWHPSGKYLAVGRYTYTTDLTIYSFNGSSLTPIATRDTGINTKDVKWSPDGRCLAVSTDITLVKNYLIIYAFNGSSLTEITTLKYGYYAYSSSWSPDGRYLAVVGFNSTFDLTIYSFNGSSLTPIIQNFFGSDVMSVSWAPNGEYLAVGGSYESTGLRIYKFNYGPETNIQALSNSIVFGNSALGSTYDLDIQGLAGTYLNIDGLVKYDNVN